jgi:hypothetical protein
VAASFLYEVQNVLGNSAGMIGGYGEKVLRQWRRLRAKKREPKQKKKNSKRKLMPIDQAARMYPGV